jgi:predicted MFS family arabinose efflux permease
MAAGYLTEFRQNWRALLSSFIGLGGGMAAITVSPSIFAPHLLREFGWTRAEFAAIGTLSIALLLAYPVVGQLADRLGARRTALIGVIGLPLIAIGLSLQNGDIRWYAALFVLMIMIGATTTSAVYTRAIVQRIEKARGLALAIVASGPGLATADGGPLLNDLVAAQGWRTGYLALAVFTAAMGALALALMPAEARAPADAQAKPRTARGDFALLFEMPAFWILMGALFLVSLPLPLAYSQMNLVLEDNGVIGAAASPMISAFAIGTLAGRFACGLALDRFPAQIVAFVALALSGVGLFLIASDFDAPMVLILAIFLFGLSMGAEADLVSYIISRTFDLKVFSTVVGLSSLAIAIASSCGGLLLSYLFTFSTSFVTFLIVAGVGTLIGAAMFLLLRSPGAAKDAQLPASGGPKAA